MRRLFATAFTALILCGPTLGFAEDETPAQEVDYLDLATLLVRDAKYERASNILAQVDMQDEALDLGRFHLLRGLVRLNLSLFNQAAIDLSAAIDHGQDAPIVPIYLGQAYFYSKDYTNALRAFARAPDKAATIPSTFAMRAESAWKMESVDEAWQILNEGLRRHPDYHELLRRKVYYAIDGKLYAAAAELGRAYLERTDASYEDYIGIGQALFRSGSVDEALRFLELARLRFPREVAVAAALSKIYSSQSKYRAAGELLERASMFSGSDALLVEAAELFRKSDALFRALALNARVADSTLRLRQRLSILLELRRYEMVAAMERDLRRVRLLQDDGIRYAVAYAHFKTRSYDKANALLEGLSDPQVFRQATDLRKAMLDCKGEGWRC